MRGVPVSIMMEDSGKLNLLMRRYFMHLASLMHPLSSCLENRGMVADAGGGSRGLRRDGAWVADESDSVADGAADGSGARWQLQRDAAVGAVDQHVAVHDYLPTERGL
ncbi:hypothetical protein ACSQ67_025102 [Phaseolus vulgaris]